MVLSEIEVIDLCKYKEPDEWIKEARKESHLLKMHYYGEGLSNYLTKIQGLENDAQINLRRKYAISNESIISSLLRAVDNAWSAKGGMININASDTVKEDLKEKIKESNNGQSLKYYLRHQWFDRFLTDPNGLLCLDSDMDGTLARPVYKSIDDICKMKVKGTKPCYVVYEPHKIEQYAGRTECYRWVVDDANYYLVKGESDNCQIVEIRPNPFGVVPSIQNSPILNTLTRIKNSPIHKQLMLLDSYLIDNSVNNIYKKLHGFPVFWFYTGKCESCKGSGEIKGKTCSSCNGTGQSMKRDVSDGIPLKTPVDSDSPTIAPNIAGYIQPALETWQEQRVEIKEMFDRIYFSHWGTTIEKADNETATGRFIDAQPVANRLHQYSDIFEDVHKSLMELYTRFYYPNTQIDVTVSYGRRYLVETPDQIWKKYRESRKEGADNSSLDLLLSQFYESEFQTDEMMRDYHLKLIKVDPLVHFKVDEVLKMDINASLKNMKTYFQDWKNVTPIQQVIDQTTETLIDNLKQFSDEQIQSLEAGQGEGGISPIQGQEGVNSLA